MAQEVAIKKVQAISKAGRNMFIAVALASVVIGFSIVGSIFLIQKMMFNAKVLGEKQNTSSILHKNNEDIVVLSGNIKVLEQNAALKSVTTNADSNALRVIPDALPSVNNPLALGASVMGKILSADTNVVIESFSLESTSTSTSNPAESETAEADAEAGTAPKKLLQPSVFHFEIKGSPDGISKAIQNLERSIRQIDITTMEITYDNVGSLSVTVTAQAYYLLPPSLELGSKEVKS